jgi:hypothetical protein
MKSPISGAQADARGAKRDSGRGPWQTSLLDRLAIHAAISSASLRWERPQTFFGAQPVGGRFDEFLMFWGVSGSEVAMIAPGGDNQGPGIVEHLENGTVELRIAAGPQVMTTATSMRIVVAGQFPYCTGNPALGCTLCDGPSHLLTMTRSRTTCGSRNAARSNPLPDPPVTLH